MKRPQTWVILGLIGAIAVYLYQSQNSYMLDPDNIRYTRDSRTGLCYAYVGTSLGFQKSVGLTQVPCSVLTDQSSR